MSYISKNLRLMKLTESQNHSLSQLYHAPSSTIEYSYYGKKSGISWENIKQCESGWISENDVVVLKLKGLIEGDSVWMEKPVWRKDIKLLGPGVGHLSLTLRIRKDKLKELGYHLNVIEYWWKYRCRHIANVSDGMFQMIKVGVLFN